MVKGKYMCCNTEYSKLIAINRDKLIKSTVYLVVYKGNNYGSPMFECLPCTVDCAPERV